MSRTRSFFSGAFFAYVYQGCAMLVGLFLTPFYIRTLGQNDYGIWLVGLQVLTFLLLVDFGLVGIVPRDVAHASGLEKSEPETDQLAILVTQTTKVVLFQTLIVAFVAFGLFFLGPSNPSLRGPIGLVLAVFVLSYPLRLFPAVLQGLQDLKFLGQLRIWLWALSAALIVILLMLGARFYALACGWCLQQLAHDLVAFLRLRRIRPHLLTLQVWKNSGPVQWRWFLRGFWVSVSQTAYSLLSGADILIMARFLGPASVVVYSCTSKLVTILSNQPQILASTALPGLSQMKTSESRERILQTTTSLTQAMILLVGGIVCIVLAVNRQFITLWLGPQFFGGMILTGLLVVNYLFRQIDNTLAVALFALGYEKLSAIRCLIDAIVSVALASLFIRWWGASGVVLGFLTSAIFVAIPIDGFLFMREFKISIFQLFRPYLPYLWRVALIGSLGVVLTMRVSVPSVFTVVTTVVSVGLAYLLFVIPHAWRSPLGSYLQAATTALRSGMRSRLLGWSNNS
jgi:O-antigen/teichoic acid export membrane protein